MSQEQASNRPAKNSNIDETSDIESQRRFLLFNVMPSWTVSFFSHIALIIILAIWLMPVKQEKIVNLEAGEQIVEELDTIDVDLTELEFDADESLETEITDQPPEEMQQDDTVPLEAEEVFEVGDVFAAETSFDEADPGEFSKSDTSNEAGSRAGSGKATLLKKYGGNAASEEAVAMALKWIADHQQADGGWNFDHRIGPYMKDPDRNRNSPNPGDLVQARAGATAIALLPFLGNGQTHKTGEYKDTVRAGLEFLMKYGKRKKRGLSYSDQGGSMYSHGLVTIVFGEAYAMTNDPELAKYAQATIWYIEDAQDPVGGGWRYFPQQAGDTSVVGWQLMGLKSGKMSGLDMNKKTYRLAHKFLDSVSVRSGAIYGYDEPPRRVDGRHKGRTAVGLLSRMYMGWGKEEAGLVDGVQWLSDYGPSTGTNCDMYYNYYATQTMKHYGGDTWKKWNSVMRDYLIKTQAKTSSAKGSWMFNSNGLGSSKGGRLYNTALSCMTLEVYYRYLPLYGEEAADDDFEF